MSAERRLGAVDTSLGANANTSGELIRWESWDSQFSEFTRILGITDKISPSLPVTAINTIVIISIRLN